MRLTTVLNTTMTGAFIFLANPSFATTLTDAMIQAYQTNPALRISRSNLRATDESVRQAKGALLPQVSANLSVDRVGNGTLGTETPSNDGSLNVQIPIYAGGTILTGIEQARYNVLANRQALKLTEQSVLFDAVRSFMDVRRDQRNVQTAINSVRVLSEEVRAANERFEVGEVTRTDVSQAESRLAASDSTLQETRAALARSIDFYIATVGSKPTDLRTPPPSPKLPSSAEAAEAIAIAKHPSILQQQFLVSAAEKAVEVAFGNKLPTANAIVSARRGENNFQNSYQNSAEIGLDFNQVIYQGGQLNSLERQAVALLDQEKAELQLTGVQVRQDVKSQYATWVASKASIQARQKQVSAAQIAFEGTTEEAKLGARTTLDALDAEQELFQARFDLVSAIRDEYVNAYSVLSTMGILNVEHLQLGVESYNPDTHYTKINGTKKFGEKRTKLFDRIKKLSGN